MKPRRTGWWGTIAMVTAIIGLFVLCERAWAMMTFRVGPDNATQRTIAQPDWYKGIVEPLKHGSRVYSVWVNGGETFYFQAKAQEINELMDLYSKAELRDHEIAIKKGQGASNAYSSTATNYPYNVTINITGGISAFRLNQPGAAETMEPMMTIFLGDDASLLKELKFPANATVTSEVELAGFKGQTRLPLRKEYFGKVDFEDSTKAVDFEHGVTTKTTLWGEKFERGIPMAGVSYQGLVRVVLSDEEMAAIKSGKMWLTLTPGNYLTEAKKTDTKFPVELLSQTTNVSKAFTVVRPQNFYYGRVLFEDGTPAVVSPVPWSGAEITVEFAFGGGRATLDKDGYFKVFFEPEQMVALKARRPSKNIYVPMAEQGHGRATDEFPPELLSQDKAKAGVVKIAKPDYMSGRNP